MKKSSNTQRSITHHKQITDNTNKIGVFQIVGTKQKIQQKFINQKIEDWRTWKISTKVEDKKPSSNEQMKKKYLQNIKDNKSQLSASTATTSSKINQIPKNKTKKQATNKPYNPENKKQKKKLRQYKESDIIPSSYNICRELAINWKYYHDVENKKVYFYPYSNMSENLKYYKLRLKELPQQTNPQYYKFFEQLDKFHNNPIYIVPEEIQKVRRLGFTQQFRKVYGHTQKQFDLKPYEMI